MPRFLAPKQSTPHRVAAIALYRALLSRCTSAPLPAEQQSSLLNAVRQKFRRNRKMQSVYQLGLAFRAGYETLDQLDAASKGNPDSKQFLENFVSSLPPGLTRAPPRPAPPPEHPLKKAMACLPPEKAVLRVRPYAHVSGPRHVPILSSANGIPFLRIKKPQPVSLSRIIRQKLDLRQKRFDQRVLLQNYWMPLAMQEDEWDEVLKEEVGFEEGLGGEMRFVDPIVLCVRENEKRHEQELAADDRIARQMLGIVVQETKLAIAEGQKVGRGRKGRRKQREKKM